MSEKAFIASHVSNKELEKQLDSFLVKLLAAIPEPKSEPEVLTDEELVTLLSTDATLMFANSKSCWEENNGTELVIDRRSGGERRRGTASKAVGAGG